MLKSPVTVCVIVPAVPPDTMPVIVPDTAPDIMSVVAPAAAPDAALFIAPDTASDTMSVVAPAAAPITISVIASAAAPALPVKPIREKILRLNMLNIESNDTGHSSLKPTTLHNRYEYFFGSFFKNNRTSRTTSTVTPAVRLILSTCKNIFSNTQSPFSCLYAHATYAHQ